jgi:hypothetical protein
VGGRVHTVKKNTEASVVANKGDYTRGKCW